MTAGPAHAGPGHNGGPSMETGVSWRRHCWTQARERLLPTLPIEVVRLRVKRAAELGLDYKTYAGVRASTGHDIVAFLFSQNALRLAPPMPLPGDRAARLAAMTACGRIALAQAARPEAVLAAANGLLDAAHPAPALLGSFAEARTRLRDVLGRIPGDRVLLVGDHSLERDWVMAGRLAGWLPAERYFAG
ncbi:hypothetical protein [Neotabrizicola shimadae]|uniref:Uncharacterized protein n=1 Tax=Neotabrizicola shimadae TaxID=2807096 RepID=A0A8G1ECN8_9RHOB|nr:hypothetical protein [Neotabrizicola shimadae]QYZ70647.1 hypothetical protein JO391_03785 [Neotabrizicola shimadae]